MHPTLVNGAHMDVAITQLVRNIDAIKSKTNYIYSQVGSNVDKIDIEA